MPDDGGDGMPMPTGLGNFKGVMLCNRPDIVAPKTKDPTELPPFYSAVAPGALEPPGMLHPTTLNPLDQKKDVPEAFKRHRKMLVEMQVLRFVDIFAISRAALTDDLQPSALGHYC